LVNKGTNFLILSQVSDIIGRGDPLTSTLYLAQFPRYWASTISGSRPWTFGVTWRYRSRDHKTRSGWFSIGGPLTPNLYLASLLRYYVSSVK